MRRRSWWLVAIALTVFPAGGQKTARRNAVSSMRDDEGRARLRSQAQAATEHAVRRTAGRP